MAGGARRETTDPERVPRRRTLDRKPSVIAPQEPREPTLDERIEAELAALKKSLE